MGQTKNRYPVIVGLMAVKVTEVFPAPFADSIMLYTFTVVDAVTVQSELGPTHIKYPFVMVVGIAAVASWVGVERPIIVKIPRRWRRETPDNFRGERGVPPVDRWGGSCECSSCCGGLGEFDVLFDEQRPSVIAPTGEACDNIECAETTNLKQFIIWLFSSFCGWCCVSGAFIKVSLMHNVYCPRSKNKKI